MTQTMTTTTIPLKPAQVQVLRAKQQHVMAVAQQLDNLVAERTALFVAVAAGFDVDFNPEQVGFDLDQGTMVVATPEAAAPDKTEDSSHDEGSAENA